MIREAMQATLSKALDAVPAGAEVRIRCRPAMMESEHDTVHLVEVHYYVLEYRQWIHAVDKQAQAKRR